MSDNWEIGTLPVKRVRRAYEQVADQLRDLIVSGSLTVGDRLPTEAELCARFQTSRSTIREALRLLSSQSLITTRAGATGGSSVAHPQITDISDFLKTTLSLLAGTSELSVQEFLEARQLLEIPAARLAAKEKGPALADVLEDFVPAEMESLPPIEVFRYNRLFHLTIVQASGNRLLQLMADPVFSVMQSRFLRDKAHAGTWSIVEQDHRRILKALRSGDPLETEAAMAAHLGNLVPVYSAIDNASTTDDYVGLRVEVVPEE